MTAGKELATTHPTMRGFEIDVIAPLRLPCVSSQHPYIGCHLRHRVAWLDAANGEHRRRSSM